MRRQLHKVRLVVADSQPIFLHGLADVFRAYPDIKLVAQCRDGVSTLNAIREFQPDVAMIDINLSRLNGLDVLAAVNAENRATNLLFLTATASEAQIMGAISGGAKGVLFKNSTPGEIARSVRKVAMGKYQLPHELAQAMRKRQANSQRQARLTPREMEVTKLVIKGMSNKEIGRQMKLSEGTIKIHLHNIYKKLSVSNRTALATMMIGR